MFKAAFLLILALSVPVCSAQPRLCQVIVTGGRDPEFCRLVGERLSGIVNDLQSGDLSRNAKYFTPAGLTSADSLLHNVRLENARLVHNVHLLQVPVLRYEVRDIRVRVDMGATPGVPYEYLVFSLTSDGLVDGMGFAMEKWHTDELFRERESETDFARRQRVLNFLEIFRTAYNEKDLDFLRRVYSDDALIVVGRVVNPAPKAPRVSEMLNKSTLTHEHIEYIKVSKEQYISRLDTVFRTNSFVRVEFDSVTVEKHVNFPNIYGINVKQEWRSATYSDRGYLFIMMDFTNEEAPLVRVRTWQERSSQYMPVPTLYDFEVIPKDSIGGK